MEGKRLSDANVITRNYFETILVEERLVDSVLPSLEMEFFGETFSSPIMMPAFSHLSSFHDRELTGLEEYSIAAKKSGIVNWCGMMENDMFAKLAATGARTVRIIKPYEDREKILDQMAFAERNGALAVGVDIDHIFGTGQYDVVMGERMAPQTKEDLRSYVETTSLPFVVKGVLSVRDAIKCAEIGVKGIVVSHHHGRMPYAVPPLMVLPEIVEAMKGFDVKIVVDCGIDTGADAYKALALGADAVSVGRAILPDLQEKGVAGVEQYIKEMNDELSMMMSFTGFSCIKELDASALWINGRKCVAD